MAVTWSLCIEEHFYLAWPVCVRKLTVPTLKIALIALLVLSPFMRIAAIYVLSGASQAMWAQAINRFTPLHLDAIATGCLLCLLWEKLSSLTWHFLLFTGAFLFGLAATVFCLIFEKSEIVYSFCFSALAIMFFVGGMALNGWLRPVFTNPFQVHQQTLWFVLIHPYVFLQSTTCRPGLAWQIMYRWVNEAALAFQSASDHFVEVLRANAALKPKVLLTGSVCCVRSACIGSVFAALRVGTTAATNAAASSTNVGHQRSGSYALMP